MFQLQWDRRDYQGDRRRVIAGAGTASGCAGTRALPVLSDKHGAGVDCAVLLGLAGVLRLAWLGHASLWIDELFSVYWSQLDLGFLVGQGARVETNPPGYYILLHGWMDLFGTTESAIRALSGLVSVATVLVVYGIGRMMFDRPTARLAGLFMAVNPLSIMFAQEARSHALSALIDGVGLLSLAGYARHRQIIGRRSWPWLAAFVLAMIASASVHYTSLLFVAACFGAIGLQVLAQRPFPAGEAIVWTAAGLLVMLALTPLLILAASLSGSNNLVWIPPPTAWSVLGFFVYLLFPLPQSNPFLTGTLLALATLLIGAGLASPRWRLGSPRFCLLVLIPGLYCALLIGGSWLRPMLLVRVASWLLIPICLILARTVLGQSRPWRGSVACTLVLIAFLFSDWYYYFVDTKEDWREAARLGVTDPRCTGPVLVGTFNALGALYYGMPAHQPVYVFLPDPRRRTRSNFT